MGLFFSYHLRMIINHQVTTSPKNDPTLGPPILEGDAYRQMRAAVEQSPVVTALGNLASEASTDEHWISQGQVEPSAALDAKRAEYTKLVEDNLPELVELISLGYVLPWNPPKVKELLAEGIVALEAEEIPQAYGDEHIDWAKDAQDVAEQDRLIDAWEAKREWIAAHADSDAFFGENRSVVYAEWERKYEDELNPIEAEEHAERVAAYDELELGIDPMQDDDPSHGWDYLDEAEAMQRSYEAGALKEERLEALAQDPQWTEATKHLDAVAAFVAQGTHNPRAYARAQSRFVGSILKLAQNHMEDTISKAVEDRFALLSHDGIEDARVLSNRLELLRVAVNEVFQYPDLNDVVGRDMVGL